MKQRDITFRFYENDVTILHKKEELSPFKSVKALRFTECNFRAPDRLNVIEVSPDAFPGLPFEKLLLVNPKNGKYAHVSLVLSKKAEEGTFAATSHLKDILQLEDADECFLCSYKNFSFKNIRVQKIDHIRENNLMLSELDYNNLLCNFQSSPFTLFEVYNTFSHDSIVVKRSHIFIDKTLAPGTIRLNRKQRLCLGLELPCYLSEEQWALLEKELGTDSPGFATISTVFSLNNHALDSATTYEEKMQAKKILAKYFSDELHIIPIPQSLHSSRKSLLKILCDFYVGKSTISLIGRRPYDIDEGLDIVRMTKSNMNLLGIDEMDKVVLQYKNKKISCRVLELDDANAFAQTNLPISPDLVVGIPAHIRKKLGLHDLSSSLKIDRDTSFIFKKSINEQIVPVLLTLFSTNVFTDSSIIWSALLSLVAIPIVLYFNLSSKRNMRA